MKIGGRCGALSAGASTLLVWVCLSLLACGDAEIESDLGVEKTKPVEIEILSPQRFTSWVHVSGLVEAEFRMSLSFRVDGTIERFLVEEGDYVEADAVIAELDSRDYDRNVRLARAAVQSAEARAAEARRELARQERLIAAKTASTQEHEAARSAVLVATADARQAALQLEAAQSDLANCQLRAPVSGYVERRLLEKHEFALHRSPVAVLVQLDRVKIRTSVADRLLASLQEGSEAIVRSDAWPDRVFEGRLVRIGLAADAKTHTLPVEISVANADLALRPATVVDVAMRGAATEELMTVPMKAVVRDGGLQPLCFVVTDADSESGTGLRAESRPVVLGGLWGDRVAIEAGLVPGDRVIVAGQHFVRSGDPVHVVGPAANLENAPAGLGSLR